MGRYHFHNWSTSPSTLQLNSKRLVIARALMAHGFRVHFESVSFNVEDLERNAFHTWSHWLTLLWRADQQYLPPLGSKFSLARLGRKLALPFDEDENASSGILPSSTPTGIKQFFAGTNKIWSNVAAVTFPLKITAKNNNMFSWNPGANEIWVFLWRLNVKPPQASRLWKLPISNMKIIATEFSRI